MKNNIQGQIQAGILFTCGITAALTRPEVKFLLKLAVLCNACVCLKPYCDSMLYHFLQCKLSLYDQANIIY